MLKERTQCLQLGHLLGFASALQTNLPPQAAGHAQTHAPALVLSLPAQHSLWVSWLHLTNLSFSYTCVGALAEGSTFTASRMPLLSAWVPLPLRASPASLWQQGKRQQF